MSYGRSCVRCRIYFVSDDPGVYICPWCQKAEGGMMLDDAYKGGEKIVVRARTKEEVSDV